MAKKKASERRPLKRDSERNSDLTHLSSVASAAITEMRREWERITGGSAEGEVQSYGGAKCLNQPMSLDTLSRMTPALLRLEAIQTWRDLTSLLIGWAFESELKLYPILRDIEKASRDYIEPQNEDRRRLHYELLQADQKTATPYSVIVLPTDLVKRTAHALMKLDYGEIDPLFQPAHRKSYKDGLTIPSLREDLLACLYYLCGTGVAISEARRKVAQSAGVSPEAVRNWGRALEKKFAGPLSRFAAAVVHGTVDAGKTFEEAQRIACQHLVQDTHFRTLWNQGEWDRSHGRDGGYSHLYELEKYSADYRAAVADQVDTSHRKSNRKK